jgi:hypothetical protein
MRSLALGGTFIFASGAVFATGKVRVVVSVDWEGREIAPNNLEAMKAFRKDYPDIPLQQFLNAAYYTKTGADSKACLRPPVSRSAANRLFVGLWTWKNAIRIAVMT